VADGLTRDGNAGQQAAQLPDLGTAARTASWALSDRSGSPAAGAVRATGSGGNFTLDGVAGLVPEGATADVLLVSAADGDGVTQFVIDAATPGVTVVPLDGLDLTRRFADVRFDDVTVPAAVVLGPPGDAQASVDAQLDVAAALTVAESVGAMARLVEITVEYTKARTAFGRPIGSFQ